MPRFVARTSAAVVLSVAATAAWISPAALAASARPTGSSPAVAAIKGDLTGVAATSAGNAWAVGTTGSASLALHWNGHTWTRVTTPGKGLGAVAASSPGNVWATGTIGSGVGILHWTGSAWKRTPAPIPARASLLGVSTTSASNAWVVGSYGSSSAHTLALHWNGRTWKRVATPDPHPSRNTGDLLDGVVALSGRNAWAVGATTSNFAGAFTGLILHWNGRSWKQASAKAVTKSVSVLTGITATSASNMWTAGCPCEGGVGGGDVGHFNGHAWAHQRTPVQRRFGAALSAVAASSRRTAFAVGSYCKSGCTSQHPFYLALILRWTGSAWKIAASPAGRNTSLIDVAVTSASNAWAVGNSPSGTVLILHWNGHSWRTAS